MSAGHSEADKVPKRGMMLEGMPNPEQAVDIRDFRTKLNELREWAGKPSYQKMENLSGQRPDGQLGYALPRSTINDHLKSGSSKPFPDGFVEAFVQVCVLAKIHPEPGETSAEIKNLIEAEANRWAEALQRLVAGSLGSDSGNGNPRPPERSGRLVGAVNWLRSRRTLVLVGAVAISALGVTIAIGSLFGGTAQPDVQDRILAQAEQGQVEDQVQPAEICKRFEVRARDLALRDDYGGPLTDSADGELRQGEKVTLQRPANALGHPEVKADDGRIGRVDPRYLKPLC